MVFSNVRASYKSISKYDKGQPDLDTVRWRVAGQWTEQHFRPVMCDSHVMSEREVLAEMDLTTSCGYPWSLAYHKKSDMLGGLGPLDVQGPSTLVADSLSEYWTKICDEMPISSFQPIWTCSQKIEMRKLKKLLDNDVRTFTAAPIEHSVATNRLCLDMNNKFYLGAQKPNPHISFWSFVGATKFMSGWDALYRRLTARFNNAFCLDESQYDSSLFAEALYGQRDIRWNMLAEDQKTPENWNRLCNVYDAIIHSVIVLENGVLIRKHTGNPSGSSNTIVDNTMILFRLFAYAWITLAEEQQRSIEYIDFMTQVEAALNGDDNTFTCSDEVVSWFCPDNIARIWSAIGVTTKTDVSTPRKLIDCDFLSQKFTYSDIYNMYFPVPDTGRVLSSLMWGANVDDIRWHLLRASALYIDSYWNKECRSVLKGYIDYLYANYRENMVGEVNGLTMQDIMGVSKPDGWISDLYSGLESSKSVDFNYNEAIQLLELEF